MFRILFLVIFFLILDKIYCQDSKTYFATRTSDLLKIDGEIDDNAWENVNWESDFIQFEPKEGDQPSEQTQFKLIYDNDNIYIAIKAMEKDPALIDKRLSRRDEWQGDMIGVHFDSYNDKRTGFVFVVSAAGVKNDGIMNDDNDVFDDSYDPIWYVKTKVKHDGWTAEFKIPFSQLRFNKNSEQVWGFEVIRSIFRKEEFSMWSPASKKNKGFVNQYGTLKGIKDIKPKKQIEIAPFAVTKLEKYEKETGNPFADGSDSSIDGGVDGKIGVTNDLILDFTVNPDFGQVEADPSEVNLSEFETYFAEKRPFFVEGKSITNFQLTMGDSPWSFDNLFYSRRIGRAPQLSPDLNDNEYAKIPNHTRILGAFKLSGKTQKGLSIGVIENITNPTYAIIDQNSVRRKEIVEPLTNYFISRVEKDFKQGNTKIGGIVTSTFRKLNDNSKEILPQHALTGGLDFTQYFDNKKYFVNLIFAASQIHGSENAIASLQTSSRRYFQRPDDDYYRYDPNRNSLSGTGGTLLAGKLVNDGFRGLLNITWRSPCFETNDVGFLRESNSAFQFIWLSYVINKPFSIFRTINFNTNQWAGFDFSGHNLFKGGNFNTNIVFKNLWSLGCGVNYEGNNISNNILRGGESMLIPGDLNYFLSLNSSSKKKLIFSCGTTFVDGFYNYNNALNLFGTISYKPNNIFNISINPNYSINKTELQYIDNTFSGNDPKYIFASLNQNTFNLTIRMNLYLTPDLSIQYYGSPFMSSVLYDSFKKITKPKAEQYFDRFTQFGDGNLSYNPDTKYYSVDESIDGTSDYTFYNPDFNFGQFRSNLVIRWEFLPGSTMFLAWSQSRTDYEECDCDFDISKGFKNLFDVTPDDILLFKISYRLQADRFL